MKRVGVIGVGLLGTAIAKRLLAAGFEVAGYDVDGRKRAALEALGARALGSPAEAARECEVLVLAVFDTAQVEQVLEGPAGVLEAAVGDSPLVICMSTCDPERLAALAARVGARGLRLLEAPVSGTSRQLEAGEAVALLGGEPALVQEAAPVLDAIVRARHYLGPLGSGTRAKLAINLVLGLNRAALAEGLVLAERLGIERAAFLEVARRSAAYSQVMDVKGPLMVRGEFARPQSRVDQSLKDFRLMLAQARAAGQELPFAALYAGLLEDCVRRGEGGLDNAAILEAIRRRRPR